MDAVGLRAGVLAVPRTLNLHAALVSHAPQEKGMQTPMARGRCTKSSRRQSGFGPVGFVNEELSLSRTLTPKHLLGPAKRAVKKKKLHPRPWTPWPNRTLYKPLCEPASANQPGFSI